MQVNEVVVNGVTELSLVNDTVSEDTLLENVTAHDASGKQITGKVVAVPVDSELNIESENAIQNKAVAEALKSKADKNEIPTSLPANGGNAATVNGFTVQTAVPANAKFTDTTYSNFVKSGSGAKAGLVPAPSTTAGTTKYLREDGTWQVPPDNNTTYGAASTTANGLMTTGAQTFAGAKTFNGVVKVAGATAAGTSQVRNIAAGTAAATTSNCPNGALYGQYS